MYRISKNLNSRMYIYLNKMFVDDISEEYKMNKIKTSYLKLLKISL